MNRGTSRRLTSAAFALAAVSCAAPAVASAATPIAPAADAYVDQAHAAASYGTKTSLLTSGAQSAYLRFDTGALAGAVQSAHLRLYAASAAASAPALSLVSNDWTEGVTWNTRPSVLGGAFAAPGAVATGSWVDYDVTSAITQSGSYSFQLSGSAASFKSREVASDAKRPQLVIATSAAADSTPPAVDIVSPTDDAEVSGQLDVTASASDASGVLSVDLSVDGVSQGSDAASPYSYAVDTSALSDGQHTLTATAVDTAGNTSEKSETVVVGNAAATQAPCSWYASPNGSPTASGRSSSAPLAITQAIAKPAAGEVVCILAGTYNLSQTLYLQKSGTAGHDVVYRSEGGTVILRRANGGSTHEMLKIASGTRYVTVDGFTIDGANIASNGFLCDSTSHYRVADNIVENTGAGGIVSMGCDYQTVDNNRLWHVGYGSGWSSAISLNTANASDSAPGFHSYVTRNILGGTDDNSGQNSDGNGIIVDLGGNTPAVLIANNLVYMNYARCIHGFHVKNVWMVNNTCYKNTMREPNSTYGTGEVNFSYCNACYAVNNVVQAWTYGNPYRVENSNGPVFSHNVYFGGKVNMLPSAIANDQNQIRSANPQFTNPIAVNDTGQSQWRSAPQAWTIGTGFTVQASSPLINAGVNPDTLVGMTADLRRGFDAAMTTDLAGHPRANGAWDVGAYEH